MTTVDRVAEVIGGSDKEATVSKVATRYLVASRYIEASDEGITDLYQKAQTEVRKWKAWVSGFDSTLRLALRDSEGLPSGYVWQDEFVKFWKPFDPIERRLMDITDLIEDSSLENRSLYAIYNEASMYLDPPRGARIEDAIQHPSFYDHPKYGKSHIAYPIRDLTEWNKKFSKWAEDAIRGLSKVISKAKKKSQG